MSKKSRNRKGPSFTNGTVVRDSVKDYSRHDNHVRAVLDETSKQTCCGVNCCKGVLYLKDHSTDDIMAAFIYDGSLVVATKNDFEDAYASGDLSGLV